MGDRAELLTELIVALFNVDSRCTGIKNATLGFRIGNDFGFCLITGTERVASCKATYNEVLRAMRAGLRLQKTRAKPTQNTKDACSTPW